MSWEIILLAGLGALAWYWYAGMQVREQAIAVGRRSCAEAELQFLDDSVALSRTRFARNSSGQLVFQRDYRFEFSDTGNNRLPGVIRMQGERVEWVSLDGEWRPGHVASVLRRID
ncbi:MAG: hypothetical protein B7X93_04150 [Hydrogenophilales bacterium 17-61-9]|nr:MAG: hypothetical protein B7X93_04150 [Hydrogenophilales bacterium 17-61-9]